MRGYGETDAPEDPAQYRTDGHLRRHRRAPRRARARAGGDRRPRLGRLSPLAVRAPATPTGAPKLVGLNTPYAPPGPVPPTRALRERFGENGYYMLWHQTPGRSEAELEADLRGNLAKIFKGADHAGDLWTMATLGGDGSGLFARVPAGGCLLTDEELDVYVRAFARTGTRGIVQLVPGARPELGGRAADPRSDDPRAVAHDHGRERPHPAAGPGRADAAVDPRPPDREHPRAAPTGPSRSGPTRSTACSSSSSPTSADRGRGLRLRDAGLLGPGGVDSVGRDPVARRSEPWQRTAVAATATQPANRELRAPQHDTARRARTARERPGDLAAAPGKGAVKRAGVARQQ